MSPMMVIATGTIAPAPKPCARRKTIIQVIDVEKPASTDATMKTAMPASMTGLRPRTSASLPNTTVVAVWANRNDAKTQL